MSFEPEYRKYFDMSGARRHRVRANLAKSNGYPLDVRIEIAMAIDLAEQFDLEHLLDDESRDQADAIVQRARRAPGDSHG